MCALAGVLLAGAVHAQVTDPAPAPAAASTATPQQAGDPLASRVGKLESQITDLQVMIGTLESLLREKPSATLQHETPPAQATESSLGARVDALETQIGALTNQLEQIGRQLTSIEARLAGDAPDAFTPPQDEPAAQPPGFRQGLAPTAPWATASSGAQQVNPRARWYGPRPSAGAPGDPSSSERTAALPAGEAAALYQQAYGALMGENYPAAEAAFRQFLALYPNDALAGNAQYWLGETYFARGDYKGAADAYLKGYKNHGRSDKAPDALLKLAMSLAALGEKQEACSTFSELDAKYPKAPEAVREQAKAERARAGC
jgi:tol-pal system protein YbgF